MTSGAPLVRVDLASIRPVHHGSAPASELEAYGLSPNDVLDFSVSTNPLGPAPSVLRALSEANWTRYPGDDEPPLRHALAGANRVHEDQVVLGNGSVELMWLVALACLRPGDAVTVLGPTFGEYARAARVAGATVLDSVTERTRLVFVCNPNNPTGTYLARAAVEGLSTYPLLVVDEAYAPFVQQRWDSAPLLDRGNVVILRSLTKDHALPGLRLGYALASSEVAQALERVRPPWSVNAGALCAGLATLTPAAREHVDRARDVVAESRALLTDGFTARGFRVWPSEANFVLVDVGNGDAFRRSLLPRGLVVRDCASFGLPSCVRVACRVQDDCRRLVAALAE
jgi:histidinol-phosphate aminotransferase